MVQGSRSFDVTIKTKLGVEFAFSQFMKCVFTRRPVRARALWTDGADELLREWRRSRNAGKTTISSPSTARVCGCRSPFWANLAYGNIHAYLRTL